MKKIILPLIIILIPVLIIVVKFNRILMYKQWIHELISIYRLENFPPCKSALNNWPRVIAHGGGNVEGMFATSSKNALNFNYNQGVRFFEIDFTLTSDDSVVLIHDWEESVLYRFEGTQKEYSFNDFLNLHSKKNLEQMDFHALVKWLEEHKDAYVITDIKGNNCEILQRFTYLEHDIKKRILPQIYSFDEYKQVRQIGYEQIIFTNYRRQYPDWAVCNFIRKCPVSAVAMELGHVNKKYCSDLEKMNVAIYVHTINDDKLRNELLLKKVYGVYSDCLFR